MRNVRTPCRVDSAATLLTLLTAPNDTNRLAQKKGSNVARGYKQRVQGLAPSTLPPVPTLPSSVTYLTVAAPSFEGQTFPEQQSKFSRVQYSSYVR